MLLRLFLTVAAAGSTLVMLTAASIRFFHMLSRGIASYLWGPSGQASPPKTMRLVNSRCKASFGLCRFMHVASGACNGLSSGCRV